MLIQKEFHDVPSPLDGGRPIRVFVISPVVPNYPQAKFPGVVVFSEIYQVTGPVERFAGSIASQGYVVACPSTYHEFEGPEAIPYDVEGTDRGNKYKIQKTVAAYDEVGPKIAYLRSPESEDFRTQPFPWICSCLYQTAMAVSQVYRPTLVQSTLMLFQATGMCLGGHLTFRAAFDPRILASVCFFATDIHSASLGKGGDDTLVRVRNGDLTGKGELVMIFGKQDTHVPRAGREPHSHHSRRRQYPRLVPRGPGPTRLHPGLKQSKGRWDAALT
ncbi:dienelactone hydrolase [Mycena metata]|uniref:Dienelactone hydrolase n=1 Tax=Mycena metata TaxID=1033252 RepID=A0AAD7P3L0_9AGAR|nr:dienelactone hydrolase [Mycena metata]